MSAAISVATATSLPIPALARVVPPLNQGENPMQLTPYLLFDGNCREAMEFYQSCLGGQLTLTAVKDSPAKDHMQPFQQNRILNAHLSAGRMEISASDWLALDQQPSPGNTLCLFLNGGTFQELKSYYDKLTNGARVTNPLQETFFGYYGALNDKFGVRWMFQASHEG
jgi:PhnB protein